MECGSAIRAKRLKWAEKLAIRKSFLICCEGVRPIFNNWRLATRKIANGTKRLEKSDASSGKCARKDAKCCRLEKVMLLFAGELRAFLIAGLSIRKSQ